MKYDDPYKEAMRYIENAKDHLKLAKKDGKFYIDEKYVRTACGTAYSGILIALNYLFEIKKIQKKRGKKNKIAYAKALIAYWGKNELGMKGTEIGRLLGVSKQAISLLVPNGEKYAKENSCNLTS